MGEDAATSANTLARCMPFWGRQCHLEKKKTKLTKNLFSRKKVVSLQKVKLEA